MYICVTLDASNAALSLTILASTPALASTAPHRSSAQIPRRYVPTYALRKLRHIPIFIGSRGRRYRNGSDCYYHENLHNLPQFDQHLATSRNSSFSRHSGSRLWTSQLGGERTYRGRAGNSRNRAETGHWALRGIASSPPEADLRLCGREDDRASCNAIVVSSVPERRQNSLTSLI